MGEIRYCVCGWGGEVDERWISTLAAHRLTQEHRLRLMEAEERRLDNIVWSELENR